MRSFLSGAVTAVFIVAFFVWFSWSHPVDHPRLLPSTIDDLHERYPMGRIYGANEYFKVCLLANGKAEWWAMFEDGDQKPLGGQCWIYK